MMSGFEMTNLGLMHYFLGIEVRQVNDGIFISQEKYATDDLHKWKMENSKPMSTRMNTNAELSMEDGAEKVDAKSHRSLVGSLMYLTATRPDIMQAVSLISKFMQSPSKLKQVLYGLKQAPRSWYSRIDNYFLKKGFNISESVPTLYIKSNGTNDILIVCLYVDD